MSNLKREDIDPQVTQEWIESLENEIEEYGFERTRRLLEKLVDNASACVNTINVNKEPEFPGNRATERKIKSLIRWNAMAMVVSANKKSPGIGGHISTYASAANLYEVGFNHFFKGPNHSQGSDLVYFQGHASPGIYARAYLEGRLSEEKINAFRRERRPVIISPPLADARFLAICYSINGVGSIISCLSGSVHELFD